MIRATQGSRWFSVIDLQDACYNIEIKEEDKHKTAFEFEGAVYEWNSMVMGFKNSPQILQRVMNGIFEGIKGVGVMVYMDDIVVYSIDIERHNRLLREVFNRLKENKMRLDPRKLQLGQKMVKLLGVTVNGIDQTPCEVKRNEALEYPKLMTVTEMKKFLGLTGWFRSFIPGYAKIVEELMDAIKGAKKNPIEWIQERELAYIEIKDALRRMRALTLPDYEKEFLLKTDASNTGLGAV